MKKLFLFFFLLHTTYSARTVLIPAVKNNSFSTPESIPAVTKNVLNQEWEKTYDLLLEFKKNPSDKVADNLLNTVHVCTHLILGEETSWNDWLLHHRDITNYVLDSFMSYLQKNLPLSSLIMADKIKKMMEEKSIIFDKTTEKMKENYNKNFIFFEEYFSQSRLHDSLGDDFLAGFFKELLPSYATKDVFKDLTTLMKKNLKDEISDLNIKNIFELMKCFTIYKATRMNNDAELKEKLTTLSNNFNDLMDSQKKINSELSSLRSQYELYFRRAMLQNFPGTSLPKNPKNSLLTELNAQIKNKTSEEKLIQSHISFIKDQLNYIEKRLKLPQEPFSSQDSFLKDFEDSENGFKSRIIDELCYCFKSSIKEMIKKGPFKFSVPHNKDSIIYEIKTLLQKNKTDENFKTISALIGSVIHRDLNKKIIEDLLNEQDLSFLRKKAVNDEEMFIEVASFLDTIIYDYQKKERKETLVGYSKELPEKNVSFTLKSVIIN